MILIFLLDNFVGTILKNRVSCLSRIMGLGLTPLPFPVSNPLPQLKLEVLLADRSSRSGNLCLSVCPSLRRKVVLSSQFSSF